MVTPIDSTYPDPFLVQDLVESTNGLSLAHDTNYSKLQMERIAKNTPLVYVPLQDIVRSTLEFTGKYHEVGAHLNIPAATLAKYDNDMKMVGSTSNLRWIAMLNHARNSGLSIYDLSHALELAGASLAADYDRTLKVVHRDRTDAEKRRAKVNHPAYGDNVEEVSNRWFEMGIMCGIGFSTLCRFQQDRVRRDQKLNEVYSQVVRNHPNPHRKIELALEYIRAH